MKARLLAVLALAACGGAPTAPPPTSPERPRAEARPAETARATPDAPFRQKPPAAEGTIRFSPPKVDEVKLKNGLRVLVVERHELPIVSVRLVVKLGAGDLPEARPGVVSFVGSMLEQGTKKRTALQISDDVEALGAHAGAWFDWDSGGASIKVLADRLEGALEILSDVALSPTFPEAEIERLRARRIAAIQAEKASPGAIAQHAIAAAVFGRSHPYGHTLTGEEADAKKITRAELVRAYERLVAPQNAALVVAGDVKKDALVPKLEAAFGGWRARAAATPRPPKAPDKPATTRRIVIVDKPGAQSQVHLVRVGVPYARKDREAVVVTNAILGGMFSSRINMNLREKHAYTYGARSHFAMRHGAGPFSVGGSMFADKTGAAAAEILAELEGLRRDGPTADELALAKESIRLAMPARFESAAEVSAAIADLVVHDLPLDDYEKRLARIEAVTAEDVKRVASELLAPAAMTLVVVGGKEGVLPQLEPLGLGPIDERDPYGNPLGTPTEGAGDGKKKKP